MSRDIATVVANALGDALLSRSLRLIWALIVARCGFGLATAQRQLTAMIILALETFCAFLKCRKRQKYRRQAQLLP
jgi:hypothetical protein